MLIKNLPRITETRFNHHTLSVTIVLLLTSSLVNAQETNSNSTSLAPMTVIGNSELTSLNPYNTDYAVTNNTTATKTDTAIMDTPLSIQVIPQQVMKDQQVISVADALKNISGVQPGAYTFYDNFMIRGFETSGTTYRNGLRQSSITNLETANLNQIEVLKGPASILFGRVEPGGLINLVTKRPQATPYYSVQQQFGSYDLYRTSVDATGALSADKKLLYRFNLAYKDNNSFRDFVQQEHIFIAPSLTWKPTDKFETNLDIEYQHDNWVDDGSDSGIPAIGTRPANIPISRYLQDGHAARQYPNIQERQLLGFDWTYHFNKDWQLKNRFQYLDTYYHQNILWADSLSADNQTLNRGLWYTPIQRTTYGTNLDLTGKFNTAFAQHQVLIGFDYNKKDDYTTNGYSDYPKNADGTPRDISINIYNPNNNINLFPLTDSNLNNFHWQAVNNWYGLYFQDHITLWDKLHILGGGRYDWAEYGTGDPTVSAISITRSEYFSPRVGVLYQPQSWLSLYANYTESFGSNNDGRSHDGKPFAPQTATQYEAGIKTEFFEGRLNSTLAFYHLTKQNISVQDPNAPLYNILVGEQRSQGIELDISGQLTKNLSLIATYAYTDTTITKDTYGNQGHQFASVPKNAGSIWAKYEVDSGVLNGLSVGTGTYLKDERQGDMANSFQLPAYVRWDANMAYSFKYKGSKITTQFNVYNLLDKTYYDYSNSRLTIHAGAPLTFMGSVRLEF